MKSFQHKLLFAALALVIAAATSSLAQDSSGRKELKRVDLSGAPGMEVVLSLIEYKPGDVLPPHSHHGIEVAYVLEGGIAKEAPK